MELWHAHGVRDILGLRWGFDGLRRDNLDSALPLDPDDAQTPDHVSLYTDRDYQLFLIQRALEVMQNEFEERTWRACWLQIIEEKPPAQVARLLNITEISSINFIIIKFTR